MGAFLFGHLDLVYVDCVRAFWALSDFKRNFVSLLELIKRNVSELVRVKEKIFVLVLTFDETKTVLSLFRNDSFFLHISVENEFSNVSSQVPKREARSPLPLDPALVDIRKTTIHA